MHVAGCAGYGSEHARVSQHNQKEFLVPTSSKAAIQAVAKYPRKNILKPMRDCASIAAANNGCVGVSGHVATKWAERIVVTQSMKSFGACHLSSFLRKAKMILSHIEASSGWGH